MGAIYFSHDEDARNDPKVTKLRVKYGMEGYGCFFAILEMFSSEAEHSLDYSQEQFDALAYDFRCSFDVKEFVDKCVEVGLFGTDGVRFWSDSFNRRRTEAEEKIKRWADKSKKGAEARWAKKRAQEQAEPKKDEPEPPDPYSLDGLDPDWLRFVQAYEQNIGMLPHGGSKAGQLIVDYFNELGADVMCRAVEETNLKHPDNPARYVLAVLSKWADMGVKTAEQAEAATLEHKRQIEGRTKKQNGQPTAERQEIRGKFW